MDPGLEEDVEVDAACHDYPHEIAGDRAEVVERIEVLAEGEVEHGLDLQKDPLPGEVRAPEQRRRLAQRQLRPAGTIRPSARAALFDRHQLVRFARGPRPRRHSNTTAATPRSRTTALTIICTK